MNYLTTAKYLFIIAIVAVLVLAGWSARGWKDYRDALQDKVNSTQEADKVTTATQDSVNQIDSKLTEEIRHAKKELDDINSRIASGRLRLSIETGMPKATGDTGMGDGATRTELNEETSRNLIGVTADGDSGIRKLTACQKILTAIKTNGLQ